MLKNLSIEHHSFGKPPANVLLDADALPGNRANVHCTNVCAYPGCPLRNSDAKNHTHDTLITKNLQMNDYSGLNYSKKIPHCMENMKKWISRPPLNPYSLNMECSKWPLLPKMRGQTTQVTPPFAPDGTHAAQQRPSKTKRPAEYGGSFRWKFEAGSLERELRPKVKRAVSRITRRRRIHIRWCTDGKQIRSQNTHIVVIEDVLCLHPELERAVFQMGPS